MCLRFEHKIRPRSAVKIYGVLFLGLKVCRFDRCCQERSHAGSTDRSGADDILGLILHHKNVCFFFLRITFEKVGVGNNGSYRVMHYGLFVALKLESSFI